MKLGPVLQVSSCVLCFLIISITSSATVAAGVTIRADMTHVDGGRGFTRSELLSRMASRSRARAASLHRGHSSASHPPATAVAAPGTLGQPGTEYLIHFAIGTPGPQHVALTLDTGSDLVWTQCTSCQVCFDQPSPLFNPSASKTNSYVPCSDPICAESSISACRIRDHSCFYLDSYGDESITAGIVLRDTFTFKGSSSNGGSAAVVPGLSFGCGLYNEGIFDTNESGIAGFGRGAQSLPSQLKVGRFSHCFTSVFGSKTSPVFLGMQDNLSAQATGPIRYTPMKPNPVRWSHYYLSLQGITVGKTRLPVDASAFAIKKDGSGGTIIDSGTGVTTFPAAVYQQLLDAFKAQVPLPVVESSEAPGYTCFSAASAAAARKVSAPKLVFHLEGADMDLPQENYMPIVDGNLLCLILNPGEGDMTLIGNFQQQNMHIIYDVENGMLFFAPAQCDKL